MQTDLRICPEHGTHRTSTGSYSTTPLVQHAVDNQYGILCSKRHKSDRCSHSTASVNKHQAMALLLPACLVTDM
jgi:hypothetical protein